MKFSPAAFAAWASDWSTIWLNVSVLRSGTLKIVFPRAFDASKGGPGGLKVGIPRYAFSFAFTAASAPGAHPLPEPPDDAAVDPPDELLLLDPHAASTTAARHMHA